MPAVALRQWTRASAPSVQLRLLPDHVARAARAPRADPAPFSRTASARSPSMEVAGEFSRGGGGTEKQTSSVVVPTGRGIISAVPGGSSSGSPTRGEGLPHSEQLSERAVGERAIDALQAVLGLMRRQEEDSSSVRFEKHLGARRRY